MCVLGERSGLGGCGVAAVVVLRIRYSFLSFIAAACTMPHLSRKRSASRNTTACMPIYTTATTTPTHTSAHT